MSLTWPTLNHWSSISKGPAAVDLERTILDVGEVNDVLLVDITVYDAKSDDASLVGAIRADPVVLFVECKGYFARIVLAACSRLL